MARVAINGFGRIGRHTLKAMLAHKKLDIVAINDLTDTKTLAHLLRYDTAYPEFTEKVSYDEKHLFVGKKKIAVFAEKDPNNLPWKKLKVDIVLECTGFFRTKEQAMIHLSAGAKKVIISAPAKGGEVDSFCRGVNCHTYRNQDIIDNASCTTNCTAPVVDILEKEFGIEKALMSTIHSYTGDQRLQDGPHKDLRRARAAAQNIIPTSTGAAIATTKIIPELDGKFDGIAFRVPTISASLIDGVFLLKKDVTVEEVNEAFTKASKKHYKGILGVTSEPLVSSDFIGNPLSSTVDLEMTRVVDGNLVKVVSWYDNEWGYANRLAEMALVVAKKV